MLPEEQESCQRLLQQLRQEEEQLHAQNQQRIKTGIRCLVWIPMVFLGLLFLTESEKAIFLVLWVVSLFIISSYLIYIEYIDFQSQERLRRFTDQEHMQNTALIGADIEAFEDTVNELLHQIDAKKAEKRQKMQQLLEQYRRPESKVIVDEQINNGRE